MGNLPKGAKTFNVIRNSLSEVYMNELPSATADNIQNISNVLFNDAYQPMLNEFVTNLINRIGLTIIKNKSFTNPLSIFKKGSMPLGTDIQELYENPAVAENYELSNTAMAKLLTITDPDTHVAYYRRNRQDLYTKTIAREALQGAFTSWDKFEDFITGITNSLYSGNYIDEFKYTKDLITGAYENNKAIIEVVSDPVDETTGKAFLKKVRALFNKMKFPSTNYNAYTKFSGAKGNVTTWTDPERVVLIIKADALASIDVDTLAGVFQLDKADFLSRVVMVDEFDNPNIVGVICDESWIQIYDNVFRFDEFYNARTMSWNEYLHAWGIWAISPFSNAVILATVDASDVTAIELDSVGSGIELDLASTPAYEDLEVTLTPSGATTNINYESSDVAIFSVEKLSDSKVRLIPHNVGSGTLKATASNGITDTANISVVDSDAD